MKIARAPQISVNDERVAVAEWLVAPGTYVEAGTAVCSIDTTKTVTEVEADHAGYVWPLVARGETVDVGKPLYVVTDTPEEPDTAELVAEPAPAEGEAAAARSWTRKAEILARRHGIDIAQVPAEGETVGEKDVLRYVEGKAPAAAPAQPAPAGGSELVDTVDDAYPANRRERILIIGGGRGAVQALDVIARTDRQLAVGIVDDNPALTGHTVMGCPVLGTPADIERLAETVRFDSLVVAFTADLAARRSHFRDLTAKGFAFANVIDPDTLIHANVRMGQGNVIMARGRVGACAVLGDNNFLSANVGIEHHCELGSHITFGPGVWFSSRTRIGDSVRLGTGIFSEPGVEVGANSIVASGAILTQPVPDNAIVKVKTDQVIRPLS